MQVKVDAKWHPTATMMTTHNAFVFGGSVDVVAAQTFCHVMPQTTRLHRLLQTDWTDILLVNC